MSNKKIGAIVAVVVVAVIGIVAAVIVVSNNNGSAGDSGNSGGQTESSSNSSRNETGTEVSAIVGKWKYDDPNLGDNFIYTFNADGTGNYTAAGDFTYKIDGNKISIAYKSNTSGATFDTEYEISGDTLNIKDSGGNDTLYKKM